MFKRPFITSMAALALLGSAHAQDSKLLELLVKKKVLTPREAEDVRADLVKEQAPPEKITLGSWVQEMKIGGDFRLRYQYYNYQPQVPPAPPAGRTVGIPHGVNSSLWRFRLRLDDTFALNGGWFGGVRLETNAASDSGNQTFGNTFTKYGIFVSRAYVGWHNSDEWLTLEAGKIPNPFYTTDLVWDPDINPDGAAETVSFNKLFGTDSGGGLSKDGKTAIAPAAPQPWELSLNLGEFIYAVNDLNGSVGKQPGSGTPGLDPGIGDNDYKDNGYLFEAQLLGKWNFSKTFSATVAPAFMFYNAASDAASLGVGGGAPNNSVAFIDGATVVRRSDGTTFTSYGGATRDLQILTAPGDISFKLGSVPAKVYWDFAWNIDGRKRAEDIYGLTATTPDGKVVSLHKNEDDFAYLVGLQLGANKKAGDISLNVNWRETGIASVDPNLNDSDFALGYLNTRGIKAGLCYNFTDFATIGATYYYAWNLRDSLVGGAATTGPAIGNINTIQIVQVDLNVKF